MLGGFAVETMLRRDGTHGAVVALALRDVPAAPAELPLTGAALSQRALGATRSRDRIAALGELIEHLRQREPAARTETARAQAGLGRPFPQQAASRCDAARGPPPAPGELCLRGG